MTQIIEKSKSKNEEQYRNLYLKPLPSKRNGALFGAFSYPTKISPETIALFIATHTNPGDTILDTFAGSGTTGLASILCENPSDELKKMAQSLNLPVKWGARKVFLYEISGLGAFISQILCNPPDPKKFAKIADHWLRDLEERYANLYSCIDDEGEKGELRHAIWSDILICPYCQKEISLWESAVKTEPATIQKEGQCFQCGNSFKVDKATRATEDIFDPLLGKTINHRKRRIVWIYGKTKNRNWSRKAIAEDETVFTEVDIIKLPKSIPNVMIPWGDLHRSGYHYGISHLHHYYTKRNLLITGLLWESINSQPKDIQPALKLLALSYNATHSTLMTRVVVKKGVKDFVVTGAQTGVLYISGLPVEKNIFSGLRRKIKTLTKAFELTYGGQSQVETVNASSTHLNLPDQSVDYVFTDPPFGDFIPYSEVNFINEVWLGNITQTQDEIIISSNQSKDVNIYGKMMGEVFSEISRVIKDTGKVTVVFHSAKSEVWQTLLNAYSGNGFFIELSSILDKLQSSFKQTNSTVSVKGDPLLLLSKKKTQRFSIDNQPSLKIIIDDLIDMAQESGNIKELEVQRLYSRFVVYYLERGFKVPLDASQFYPLIEKQMETR
jgi:16S rRNA G966 N2-methylase RsmD